VRRSTQAFSRNNSNYKCFQNTIVVWAWVFCQFSNDNGYLPSKNGETLHFHFQTFFDHRVNRGRFSIWTFIFGRRGPFCFRDIPLYGGCPSIWVGHGFKSGSFILRKRIETIHSTPAPIFICPPWRWPEWGWTHLLCGGLQLAWVCIISRPFILLSLL